MKSVLSQETKDILAIISRDRARTNLLRNPEQNTLAFLVKHIPSWITSGMLTFIGFSGSLVILLSLMLGAYVNRYYLLLGIFGFSLRSSCLGSLPKGMMLKEKKINNK